MTISIDFISLYRKARRSCFALIGCLVPLAASIGTMIPAEAIANTMIWNG